MPAAIQPVWVINENNYQTMMYLSSSILSAKLTVKQAAIYDSHAQYIKDTHVHPSTVQEKSNAELHHHHHQRYRTSLFHVRAGQRQTLLITSHSVGGH